MTVCYAFFSSCFNFSSFELFLTNTRPLSTLCMRRPVEALADLFAVVIRGGVMRSESERCSGYCEGLQIHLWSATASEADRGG